MARDSDPPGWRVGEPRLGPNERFMVDTTGRRRRVREISPDECAMIERLAGGGAREVDLALALGLKTDVWRWMRQNDPEVRDAYERGRGAEHGKLVSSLMERALDPSNPSGAASAMFLLKTRHGYNDRGGATVDSDDRVRIQISLPAALPAESYEKLLGARPALAEIEATVEKD